MKVILRKFNHFLIKDAITDIYVHEEKYRGLRIYMVDKIDIHGSIEYLELIHILKQGIKKIKNHEWVIE